MSTIIVLNGCSSVGKSSIAKALQELCDTPTLQLGIDTFMDMMPPQYVAFGEKAHEGFHFIQQQDEKGPLIRIEDGEFGRRIVTSVPKVVRLLADDGHNLILDTVLFEDDELKTYVQALKAHAVYFVGIMCDPEVMQEREVQRRDRAIGLARGQLERVHGPTRHYDLMVDTTHTSPHTNAQAILDFVRTNPVPQSFLKLEQIFGV